MRTKPRNLKYKAKLRARVEADSIEAKPDMAIQPEAMVASAKTTKTREKAPCKYCEKLFVYPGKHEKNCKKNPAHAVVPQEHESIAIKA